MKNIMLALLINLLCSSVVSGQLTTQEKLGYSKETKLLIIHADDLGVSHSENIATIQAMEKGAVNSASIMVPTPWFSEIASYAVSNPKADFGLHLTLTSEWKYYKWGSLLGKSAVPGLTNKNGFLFASVDSVYKAAKLEEVKNEIRAQIEKAKQFGIDFTHFDSHMGALYGNTDYLQILLDLGREYKVPVMLNKSGPRSAFNIDIKSPFTEKDVQLDYIHTASPEDFKTGMDKFYTRILESLQPGVGILIIHTAYDDQEMQAITVDHPEWGANWRQQDFNFFTSEACKKILAAQNIKLITWREIRDKLIR